jgi:hypothetical protein
MFRVARCGRQFAGALIPAVLAQLFGFALGIHHQQFVACVGQSGEPRTFTGIDGPAAFTG